MLGKLRKGQVGVAVALIGFAIVVVIGLFILAQIQNTMNFTNTLGCLGEEGNLFLNETCQKINETFDTGYDSLKLLSVGIIVLAAAAIIGIVSGLGGGRA